MIIDLSGQQKLLTVRLDGELDHFTTARVREAVESELVRTGAVNVAFDFSGVTFMDSSGIGILFGMNGETERIMRMSGVDRIAEIY